MEEPLIATEIATRAATDAACQSATDPAYAPGQPWLPKGAEIPSRTAEDLSKLMAGAPRKPSQSEAARIATGKCQLHLRVDAETVAQLDELVRLAGPGIDRSSFAMILIDVEFGRAKRRKR